MKALRKIAMFAIALIALFAFEAKGQTPQASTVPAGLPQSLPMFANTNEMVTWLITNQPANVNVFVHYIDKEERTDQNQHCKFDRV